MKPAARAPSGRPPHPARAAPAIPAATGARGAWLGWAAVLLAVLIGWRLRLHVAHSIPTWDRGAGVGLLKSDPALLLWFTEKIAENGGSIPDDFAHTKAVQWPDAVDARSEFPMAQPWLAANVQRWFGGTAPLHETCASLFGLLAALSAVAAYGLAWELTRRRGLALLALATWMLLPANWRSLGAVLLGEDLSLPAFAWHLWLLARAARVRTPAAFLLAGLPLALAMAAWHAMGFFVAIEAGVFLAWYLRSGQNPFAPKGAWLVLLPFALACVVEPVLRGKLQLLSLPMQIAFALLVLAWVERRRRLAPLARAGAAIALVGAFLGLALAGAKLLGSGLSDYSHVFALIAAKLEHMGRLPRDPNVLPFEVRALWQGPFDTATGQALRWSLSTTLVLAALLVVRSLAAWAPGRGNAADALLALGCVVALFASWLINRTLILSGLLFPVAAVVLLRTVKDRALLAGAALLLLAPPAWKFGEFIDFAKKLDWNDPVQKQELVALVDAIGRLVPPGEPVAADEVNGAAILAYTDRPLIAQPKYESKAARLRLEGFRTAAIRGTPAELAAFLRRHQCRFLAFDCWRLWGSRYQAGIPDDVTRPQPETALSIIGLDPEHLPGFELLWKSPLASDRLRLYVLADE